MPRWKSRGHGDGRHVLQVITERDGATCWLCKAPVNMGISAQRRPDRPTVDHKRPRSRGGTNELGNLRLAHGACNERRGDRFLGSGTSSIVYPVPVWFGGKEKASDDGE